MKSNVAVSYDPGVHDGLLRLAGNNVIIADATEAKLTEMPQDVQDALANGTVDSMLELLLLSEMPLLVSVSDPQIPLQGMKRGLELLGRDANQMINDRLDEIRKEKHLPPLPPEERHDWV